MPVLARMADCTMAVDAASVVLLVAACVVTFKPDAAPVPAPASTLRSACVGVTTPVTLGNVALTVLLIRRRWSSPSLLGSEAAG